MRQEPPPLPWLQWQLGQRVVVRYQAADGVHDALGTLLETAPDHVVIEARRGTVRVEASTMITGRAVPNTQPRGNRPSPAFTPDSTTASTGGEDPSSR